MGIYILFFFVCLLGISLEVLGYFVWNLSLIWVFLMKGIGFLMVLWVIHQSRILRKDISWVILILLLPVVGILLYLMFGSDLFLCQYLKRFDEEKKVTERPQKEWDISERYLICGCGKSLRKNNEVKYYSTGEAFLEGITSAIKGAEKFIFMEFFSISLGNVWNQVLDILKKKVKEGVEVYLIYDEVSCKKKLPSKYFKELEKMGICCCPYFKGHFIKGLFANHRDHRKLVIVDGKIAFTGGMNLEDCYVNLVQPYGVWKDVGISVRGSAALDFTKMFLKMWQGVSLKSKDFSSYDSMSFEEIKKPGTVIVYEDQPIDQESVSRNLYLSMIYSARRSIFIFTPYLILNDDLEEALILARKRGVEVSIVIPGIPDKKMVYCLTKRYARNLMNEGISVYCYTKGFMHGKVMLVDAQMASVGTVNWDYRSLYFDFEDGVYLKNVDVLSKIKEDILKTIDESSLMRNECHWFDFLIEGFLELWIAFM